MSFGVYSWFRKRNEAASFVISMFYICVITSPFYFLDFFKETYETSRKLKVPLKTYRIATLSTSYLTDAGVLIAIILIFASGFITGLIFGSDSIISNQIADFSLILYFGLILFVILGRLSHYFYFKPKAQQAIIDLLEKEHPALKKDDNLTSAETPLGEKRQYILAIEEKLLETRR